MMLRRDLLAGAPAALLLGCTRTPGRSGPWPTAMTMGTGSTGGTYGVYGPAWGAVVEAATGINISYRATEGPNQNILLMDRGLQLGMATTGVARQAWDGLGSWTRGTRFRSIRALFPMYGAPFHGFALARSGINRLTQFGGRAIGVGEQGGTSGTYVPMMLSALGIHPREMRFGGFAEQTRQLLDGSLDACLLAGGAPIPSIAEADRHADLRFIGFNAHESEKLRRMFPELTATVIPRNTYRSLHANLAAVSMYNFALCRYDLPDDLAQAITASVLQNRSALLNKTPVAAETVAANVTRDTVVPFHPGAAAYYASIGVRLPDFG
jgi:TRAP transporter TAXI family solute receptor